MQVTYLVNRMSEHLENRIAEVDGEPMNVLVSCLEVELVDEQGSTGSQTLRFFKNEDKADAQGRYVEGESIVVDV